MSKGMAMVDQGHEVMSRRSVLIFAFICAIAAPGVVSTAAAQSRASNAGQWEVPRTPDGHPDLQGNWTNQTMTPIQRPEDQGPVYTPEFSGHDRRVGTFESAKKSPTDLGVLSQRTVPVTRAGWRSPTEALRQGLSSEAGKRNRDLRDRL